MLLAMHFPLFQILPVLCLIKMNQKNVRKGKFRPKNPRKYVGNVNNIIYRSSWELTFMQFLDQNSSILNWGSEIIAIPYIKPTTGKVHKYYPDFWVKYKNKKGVMVQELIEVKPEKQTKQPTTVGKNRKTQLYEAVTFTINTAKWKAAKLFCDKYNMTWKILTERQIFK